MKKRPVATLVRVSPVVTGNIEIDRSPIPVARPAMRAQTRTYTVGKTRHSRRRTGIACI